MNLSFALFKWQYVNNKCKYEALKHSGKIVTTDKGRVSLELMSFKKKNQNFERKKY